MKTTIYHPQISNIYKLLLQIYSVDKVKSITNYQIVDIINKGYSSNSVYVNQLKNIVPIVRYLYKLYILSYKWDINAALPDVLHNYKLTGNIQIDRAYLKKIKHKQMIALIKLTMLHTMLDQ